MEYIVAIVSPYWGTIRKVLRLPAPSKKGNYLKKAGRSLWKSVRTNSLLPAIALLMIAYDPLTAILTIYSYAATV